MTDSTSTPIARVMTTALISKKTRAKCCRVFRLISKAASHVVRPPDYTDQGRFRDRNWLSANAADGATVKANKPASITGIRNFTSGVLPFALWASLQCFSI